MFQAINVAHNLTAIFDSNVCIVIRENFAESKMTRTTLKP